jgi:hypothetical protein
MKSAHGGVLGFASHDAEERAALMFGNGNPSGLGGKRKILKLD